MEGVSTCVTLLRYLCPNILSCMLKIYVFSQVKQTTESYSTLVTCLSGVQSIPLQLAAFIMDAIPRMLITKMPFQVKLAAEGLLTFVPSDFRVCCMHHFSMLVKIIFIDVN